MIAVIDIGSNTVRMNVYKLLINDQLKQSGFQFLFSEKEMAGLASHIENNELSSAGLRNLLKILKGFRLVLDKLSIEKFYPFATASLRNITNSEEVLQAIEVETGFKIHLISGEDEGYLGFFGSRGDISSNEGFVTDIGGGSTELVHFKDEKVISAKSLTMGSLSMFKQHVSGILPTNKEQKAIKNAVQQQLKKNFPDGPNGNIQQIVGVGGTIRAALDLKQYLHNNHSDNVITYQQLLKVLHSIDDGSSEAKTNILKVIPNRIHTIIPGLIILKETMKFFGCQELVVSQTGAREGYLLKYVLRSEH